MNESVTASPAPFSWLRRFVVGRNFKWTLIRILVLLLVTGAVFKWWLLLIRVAGDSMLPTYQDGEICVVYRRAYVNEPPKRGDVVVIGLAGRYQVVIKRIVGLPGEKVEWRSGKLWVNDEPLTEPYVHFSNPNWYRPPVILRPEEYFFVGDNRAQERMTDHTHGEIRQERILGRVIR